MISENFQETTKAEDRLVINKGEKTSTLYIFTTVLVASIGGFLFGFDLVVIAGALPLLEQYFHLSSAMKGFAVSTANLGALAGPLVGLWFTERLGRKKTMMLAALFFMVSTI